MPKKGRRRPGKAKKTLKTPSEKANTGERVTEAKKPAGSTALNGAVGHPSEGDAGDTESCDAKGFLQAWEASFGVGDIKDQRSKRNQLVDSFCYNAMKEFPGDEFPDDEFHDVAVAVGKEILLLCSPGEYTSEYTSEDHKLTGLSVLKRRKEQFKEEDLRFGFTDSLGKLLVFLNRLKLDSKNNSANNLTLKKFKKMMEKNKLNANSYVHGVPILSPIMLWHPKPEPIAQYLIEEGANINQVTHEAQPKFYQSPILINMMANEMHAKTRWLIECNESHADKQLKPEIADVNGRNIFHWACIMGQLPVMKCVAKNSMDGILREDNYGFTPMHLAVMLGRSLCVDYISENASEAIQTKSCSLGCVPFEMLTTTDRSSIVRVLESVSINPEKAVWRDGELKSELAHIEAGRRLLEGKGDTMASGNVSGNISHQRCSLFKTGGKGGSSSSDKGVIKTGAVSSQSKV